MGMLEEKTAPLATAPEQLAEAIRRAQAHLLDLQHPAGYWAGELEADASVTAGYVPLMYYMTGSVDPARRRKAVNFVQSKQRSDGSWSSYHGGPGDLNVSIQCYFSLKLSGVSGQEPSMQRARDFILAKGGIGKANVFTKIWLALFGQFDWRGAPTVPPEVILLPDWFYINIYEFASWSRATIVALTIVLTDKPVCRVPEQADVSELYVEPAGQRVYPLGKADRLLSWRAFFLWLDSLCKRWEKLPLKPGRGLARRRTEEWIVSRQEADGSWGGIMLPWVYSLVALKCLGRGLDDPAVARGLAGLEGFIAEDDATFRLLPATSPVWDTAWAVIALSDSGLPNDHPALRKAASWLLRQQILVGGDWQVKNPRTPPGCWAFEFANNFYPDMDDGAVVPLALLRVRLADKEEEDKARAIARALRWVASMQSKDGGWAAFDLNNDKQMLAHVPFADFMTPLDPTCADVTAHVLELLGTRWPGAAALRKGLRYLQRTQEADGAWYGRWGVNYVYGTGLVLGALRAAGVKMTEGWVRRAQSWLVSRQNPDGGWGETCATYAAPELRGSGRSTASQTAWALLGLLAAGEGAGRAVGSGIDYLLRSQRADGSWAEDEYTGTGFPRAFYLHYDLYRAYFPLMALARYRAGLEVAP